MRVRVNVKEMGIKDRLADLEAIIWGDNLHAPLIERLLELPMDIYAGVCPAMTLMISDLIHVYTASKGQTSSLGFCHCAHLSGTYNLSVLMPK